MSLGGNLIRYRVWFNNVKEKFIVAYILRGSAGEFFNLIGIWSGLAIFIY